MSNNHLEFWESVQETDPNYVKKFSRPGGFKGSSVSATYLVKKATEMFGENGIGWGMEILEETVREGAPIIDSGGVVVGHEMVHIILARMWYLKRGDPGTGVESTKYYAGPHFGQTMLVGKNKYGPYTDEEAPKKSLTDAMTKCMSMLGFAADIHLGQYDDNKYVNDMNQKYGAEHNRPPKASDLPSSDPHLHMDPNDYAPPQEITGLEKTDNLGI